MTRPRRAKQDWFFRVVVIADILLAATVVGMVAIIQYEKLWPW